MFLDEITHISEYTLFICHKWGAKWYLQGLNGTIPSQSDETYICSIYIDIDKKFTASKLYQLKKSQVVPEEALNKTHGEISALFIVNENTQDIVPSPHNC